MLRTSFTLNGVPSSAEGSQQAIDKYLAEMRAQGHNVVVHGTRNVTSADPLVTNSNGDTLALTSYTPEGDSIPLVMPSLWTENAFEKPGGGQAFDGTLPKPQTFATRVPDALAAFAPTAGKDAEPLVMPSVWNVNATEPAKPTHDGRGDEFLIMPTL